jgi:hypothetical protein
MKYGQKTALVCFPRAVPSFFLLSDVIGPLAVTSGNSIALLPLKQISPGCWESIVGKYLLQDNAEFLPASYTPEQIAGYQAQPLLLADSMSREDNAVMEVPFVCLLRLFNTFKFAIFRDLTIHKNRSMTRGRSQ